MPRTTLRDERLHETNIARNGQKMEIIAYHGSSNIDVQFEDNTIVKHKSYYCFSRGEIRNPNINYADYSEPSMKPMAEREGEKSYSNISKIGMRIAKYRNANSIDVIFDDGLIYLNKHYKQFVAGQIKHPTDFENGIRIEKLAYIQSNVYYYVCSHADWTEPKILSMSEIWNKPVGTPTDKDLEPISANDYHVGMTTKAKNGHMMTVIADNGAKDITVQFDDGTIVYHQRRKSFCDHFVRYPDKASDSEPNKTKKDQHIDEIWFDKDGNRMQIIEFNSNSNVTIRYDDGLVLKDKEYRVIKRGACLRPKSMVNKTVTARSGMKMTCIKDRNWDDIDVQFEDGTIVQHVSRSQFLDRAVAHPNYNARTTALKSKRIGETYTMDNGHTGKLVEYINAKDITIEYEYGLLYRHMTYQAFKTGRVGFLRDITDTLKLDKLAYVADNKAYYYVNDTSGNKIIILSVDEINRLTKKED